MRSDTDKRWSEATEQSRLKCEDLDCFASLAMTPQPLRRKHGEKGLRLFDLGEFQRRCNTCGRVCEHGMGVVGTAGRLIKLRQR
jgi:hypothetical protein